ncbi:MAG TPA: CBS domain-containing protein [Thermoplasmata archaeon]|nr:CBS domain-containing protein [Thermoplasmata archaeon]
MAQRGTKRKTTAAQGPTARDLMTKDPIVARLPGTRTEVLRLLVTHRLTGVPVVREDRSLAGLVTRHHIFAKPLEEQLAMVMDRNTPSIEETASLTEVATIFREIGVHHLPVVRRGKLVGILTPADLLERIAKSGFETPVEQLVRSPCVAVHDATPINVASEIMRLSNVVALAVLDDVGHLSGLVTDRDIFALSQVNGRVAQRELGIAGDEDAWNSEGLKNVMRLYWEERKVDLPRRPVREVMVPKPVTVFRKTNASEAARLMWKNDFGQLPVVDSQDRIVAMLYDVDLMTVVARLA